jgi:hypothetical protein
MIIVLRKHVKRIKIGILPKKGRFVQFAENERKSPPGRSIHLTQHGVYITKYLYHMMLTYVLSKLVGWQGVKSAFVGCDENDIISKIHLNLQVF